MCGKTGVPTAEKETVWDKRGEGDRARRKEQATVIGERPEKSTGVVGDRVWL